MNRFISLPVHIFKKLGNKVLSKVDQYNNKKTQADSTKIYDELMTELEALAKDFMKEIESLDLSDEDKTELDAATNSNGEMNAEALATFAKRYSKNSFSYLMETVYLQHQKAGLLSMEDHSLWIEKSARLFQSATRAYSIALSSLVMEYQNNKTKTEETSDSEAEEELFFTGWGTPAEG